MAMSFEEWEASNSKSTAKAESPVLQPTELSYDDWVRNQNPVKQAAQEQGFMDRALAPNEPEPFDLATSAKRVGLSTGIGAAVGGATGVGLVPGVVGGAVSGIAGEIARNSGASDAVTFGAELLGGEAPTIGKAAANFGHSLISAYNYRLGRLTGAFTSKADRDKAIEQMQEKVYGKSYFELGHTVENMDRAQTELAMKYLDGNIPMDGKVSDKLRQNLYDSVRGLQNKMETVNVPDGTRKGWLTGVQEKNPTYFSKSHWGYSTMEDLKDAVAQGKVTSKEVAYIQRILAGETSNRVVPRTNFPETMLRLIQNGGERIVGRDSNGVVKMSSEIGEEAQGILRENFDNFLAANTGKEQYTILKQVEQQEGIAKAKDLLPVLLQEGMKPSNPSYKTVVGYLSKSPEGKQEFAKALMQKFGSLTSTKQMIAEYNRVVPALRMSKMLTHEEMATLRKKVDSFDDKVSNQEAFNFWFKQALMAPLMSAMGSEVSAKTFDKPKPNRMTYGL
jgi:hypothetical protein